MEQGHMRNDALEQAKKCLQIRDVWMNRSKAWIADGFDPKYSRVKAVSAQFKHGVSRYTFSEVTDKDKQESQFLFRVYLDLGMRLIPGIDPEQDPEDKTDQEAQDMVLAQLEAVMVAEYLTDNDPGQDALEAFAAQNASYHAWPFWREYLVSQCERMRLPRVMVPTMMISGDVEKTHDINV